MSSQKFIAGVIVGAAAAAAIALFLQSDKGKEIIADLKNAANDAGDNLKSKVQDFDDELNALIKKGKQFVQDLEDKAKDSISAM